jgi:membrane fusion protein, multidrug efflux system
MFLAGRRAISAISPGAKSHLTNRKFRKRSERPLLPPDNATGNFTKVVQRVPVKIALENSALTSQLTSGTFCGSDLKNKKVGEAEMSATSALR